MKRPAYGEERRRSARRSRSRRERTRTSPNTVPPVSTMRGAPGGAALAGLLLDVAEQHPRADLDLDAFRNEQVDVAEHGACVDLDHGLRHVRRAQVEHDVTE